jgi:ABC-type branched-subunit amino acid transport system ATPase component
LTGPLNLTWRGVFVTLGVLAVGFTAVALRLRDPGFGQFDMKRIRQSVHEAHGESATVLHKDDVELGFFEIVRRLMLIPSVRRLVTGQMVLGIFSIPLNAFVAFFLDEKYGFGPTARSLFFGLTSMVGVVAIALYAKRGEAEFRKDPARIPVLAGIFFAATVLSFGLAAVVPSLAGVIILFCIGFGVQSMLYPILQIATLSLAQASWRPHLGALGGIALSIGGFLGALFLSGIERRFGLGGSLVALTIPGLAAAGIVASARKLINADLDRMITDIVEDEEIARIRHSGAHLPMLTCRKIDFAYGKLQVLFNVDFTVDEGEMVALLGVNGAGKSTLLKCVSGIGLPSGGSVRYRGQDITYLDAERRLRLGITQVPGGRAVFPPLTVIDNLRVYGYALGKDQDLDAAIERSFEAFPRLYERRNQFASTLSGGEQQMLGLCKALILKPKLLLIDELSLGLAPVIVGQLLEMVREINKDGTAVVLVEQSVNIALTVANHAYFMERGQVRFDGPSTELLNRGDLLRAVFLEGAHQGENA